MKGRDGNWDAYYPKETRDADLGNNGRLTYGTLGGTVFLHIRKPDDVSLGTFCDDSKLLMDLILKGLGHYRQIGSENIKIISMGRALESYRFTDSYGRIWMVNTWLTEYNDRKVVTFSLPVPGGCIVLMRTDQTGVLDQGHIPDLKVLSDFIYVSYLGTFREWQEFLTMRDFLPSIFSTLDIHIENNKVFRYKSARLSFSYGPDVMKISDKSHLQVDFSYFQEEGRTLWDVKGMMITEEKYSQMGYVVYRMMKPSKDLGDEYQSNWVNMVDRRFPYNRSAYHKDKITLISTIYNWTDKSEKEAAPSGSVLYTVGLIKEGSVDQKEMETKLEMFVRNLIVYEKGEDNGPENGNPQAKD